MSGDALKKVNPGDPLRIPARTYNRFIDAARAQQERRRLFGRMPGSDAPRANVAHACNASGQAAPMHGVVDLVAPSQTESQLEFVKPGGGTGTHGIALEPVAPGALGLVALSGGVYEALVSDDAAPGDRLKPASGSWHLEKGSGVFQAVADPKDGLVRVVFASGVTYYPGRHISIYEDEWGRLVIRETGTRADGSEQLRIEVRDSDPAPVGSLYSRPVRAESHLQYSTAPTHVTEPTGQKATSPTGPYLSACESYSILAARVVPVEKRR